MVTMSDVAKAAGVSRATASYALRGDPRIIAATARKVRKAAQKLQYTTNLSARSLRSGHNGVIGIAIFELDKPYPSEMSAALSREANRHGLQAITQQTSNSKEGEISILQKVTSQLCDGTIFSPSKVSAEEIKVLSGGKPIVLLDDISDEPLFDTVFTACEDGAEMAVAHLVDIGCTNIIVMGASYEALLEDSPSTSVSSRRLSGALKALEERNVAIDPANFIRTDWTAHAAREATDHLFEAGRRWDGMFCMTDSMALGALRGLADHGVKVPQDVALIGFDGINEGEYSIPSLSTIHTDLDDLASKAIGMLTHRIEGTDIDPSPQLQTAQFDLVIRESTRRD